MRKIVINFRLCILLYVFLGIVFNGRGEDVVISSGILNETMFNGKNPVPNESSKNEFQATVSTDGRWFLQISPIHGINDPMYGKKDTIYMSFDGSDTYFCQYSEAVIGITNGRPGLIGTQPLSDRSQLSYISEGNYPYSPFDSQKRAHILWLVYGAGKSIHDSKQENMPLPWLAARWTPLSYGFRLESDLSPNLPYIPISLRFIRDSKLDLQDENNEYSRPEIDIPEDKEGLLRQQDELNQRKTKWHNGANAGILKTGVFTNISEFSMPLTFTFTTFLSSGNPRRLYEATVTNVVIRQIDEVAQKGFQPPILANLSVLDTRFRFRDASHNVDKIYYKIDKNESWQPKDSPELQKMNVAFIKSPSISARTRFSILSDKLKRLIIGGIFLIVTLVPVIFLLRFRPTVGGEKKQKTTDKL